MGESNGYDISGTVNDYSTGSSELPASLTSSDAADCPGPSSVNAGGCPAQTTAKSWTRQQKITIFSLAVSNFCGPLAFSIIAPFFPQEAALKGASDTEVGFIFGVFELVIFIMAPIYGSSIVKIGAKFMFVSGSFMCASCLLLFGFLDRCPNGAIYVGMCFACRIVEANGAAMLNTASFAIMAHQFPVQLNLVMGILEGFGGLGLMLGPPLGGLLYAAGGYRLPFIVVSVTLMLSSAVSYFLLPALGQAEQTPGGFFQLFKIKTNVVVFCMIFGSSVALSFLDPTLSKHVIEVSPDLQQKPILIGIIFLVGCGTYALTAPLLGWLCDKGYLKSQMIAGAFTCFVAYFIMGPSPLLHIESALWLVIVSLVLLGVGVGMALLPTFQESLLATTKNGYANNLQTYGMISGFYSCGFSLGAFVGPTAAGYLADQYNFDWASTVCAFLLLVVGLIMAVFTIVSTVQQRNLLQTTAREQLLASGSNNDDESKPLLMPPSGIVNIA